MKIIKNICKEYKNHIKYNRNEVRIGNSPKRTELKTKPNQTNKPSNQMKLNKNIKRNAAFSLIEMLVVIAVIGIIAAIAVPNIGRINDAAQDSKNMRNAQNLASVCAAAQAAGLDFVATATDPADEATIVPDIVTGGTVTDVGPFQGTYFGVPNLSGDDQTAALAYLGVANGMLVYSGP